jgi:cathepsin L
MSKLFFTFFIVALIAMAFVGTNADLEKDQDDKLQLDFIQWMRVFKKSYSTGSFFERYATFRANSVAIKQHNDKFAKGEVTYQHSLNQFADLSANEFRAQFMRHGLRSSMHAVASQTANTQTASNQTMQLLNSTGVPESKDWRQLGKITAVKDQGSCGSCWAFSAVGSMEGAYALSSNNLRTLSEQMLVDCVNSGSYDCATGGIMNDAFTYVISAGGAMSSAEYPYTATDRNQCRFDRSLTQASFQTFHNIPEGDEVALKTASAAHPGISIGVDASNFQFYSGGVFNPASCGNTETSIDHGVLLVGYGTDASGDYWIVKNSWGATWGESGYIRIARNQNNKCGVATMASYIVA